MAMGLKMVLGTKLWKSTVARNIRNRGYQKMDNRQNIAEARLHESDLYDGTRGLVWSNEEASQSGEILASSILLTNSNLPRMRNS